MGNLFPFEVTRSFREEAACAVAWPVGCAKRPQEVAAPLAAARRPSLQSMLQPVLDKEQ
jgi:hypothetical protein